MVSAFILTGDCRAILPTLPAGSAQCCVTSPPFWGLRDYGHDSQIGLEPTPEAYVAELVGVFREVWRVLAEDGVLWVNLGDSYSTPKDGNTQGTSTSGIGSPPKRLELNKQGFKKLCPPGLPPKFLVGIPWRTAFALQADGWILRQDIIWAKPNPMPESVTDRCTKAHEYLFMLVKQGRYYWDQGAMMEQSVDPESLKGRNVSNPDQFTQTAGMYANTRTGFAKIEKGRQYLSRNRRSVWTVATQPYAEAHFATFPPDLIRPCILATSRPGDTVLDPFGGSGTTGQVAVEYGRNAVLIELNEDYARLSERRTATTPGLGI